MQQSSAERKIYSTKYINKENNSQINTFNSYLKKLQEQIKPKEAEERKPLKEEQKITEIQTEK